jgi:hypothetical protein
MNRTLVPFLVILSETPPSLCRFLAGPFNVPPDAQTRYCYITKIDTLCQSLSCLSCLFYHFPAADGNTNERHEAGPHELECENATIPIYRTTPEVPQDLRVVPENQRGEADPEIRLSEITWEASLTTTPVSSRTKPPRRHIRCRRQTVRAVENQAVGATFSVTVATWTSFVPPVMFWI